MEDKPKKEDMIPGDTEDMVAEMVQDRNEALLSLNEELIRAYCKKWDVDLPKEAQEFWEGVHIARIQVKSFPEKVKRVSYAWLQKHKSRIVKPKSDIVIADGNTNLEEAYRRKVKQGKLK